MVVDLLASFMTMTSIGMVDTLVAAPWKVRDFQTVEACNTYVANWDAAEPHIFDVGKNGLTRSHEELFGKGKAMKLITWCVQN